MKTLTGLLALLLAFSAAASAQERGVAPVATPFGTTARVAPTPRTVVVGISDYQDEGVPNLVKACDLRANPYLFLLKRRKNGILVFVKEDKLWLRKQETRAVVVGISDYQDTAICFKETPSRNSTPSPP